MKGAVSVCFVHSSILKMEAIRSSEASVKVYQITRRCILIVPAVRTAYVARARRRYLLLFTSRTLINGFLHSFKWHVQNEGRNSFWHGLSLPTRHHERLIPETGFIRTETRESVNVFIDSGPGVTTRNFFQRWILKSYSEAMNYIKE
jgi:hypothetical protein